MTDYLVDGEATYNYAYLYHLINERVDMKEKISNYKKFASLGSQKVAKYLTKNIWCRRSQYDYGFMLNKGDGISKNKKEIKYLNMSADNGNILKHWRVQFS